MSAARMGCFPRPSGLQGGASSWAVAFAALGATGCPVWGEAEGRREDDEEEALPFDKKEDHGAHDPWVECSHRTQAIGTDALGPQIAHGTEEAPGYEGGEIADGVRVLLRHGR